MDQSTENTNPSQGANSNTFLEEKSVAALIQAILKKWWLFGVIGIAGGLLGIMYAGLQKPVYESHLTFALDEGGGEGAMSGALGLAAQFGLSIGGAKDVFNGDNILEIMTSRRIIERVLLSVDTFDSKPYTFIEYYLQKMAVPSGRKIPEGVHYLPGDDRTAFKYAKDSLLQNVFQEFQLGYIAAFRPNKKLNIYEVSVKSPDEIFTKKITDKLIEATNHFYTEISSKKAKETLAILESRVPEMKNMLNKSIGNRAAAQDANLNPSLAQSQVPAMKEQVNSQVYGAAYAEMYKNLEMARFQYLKSIPLMQIIDNADYPMKKVKMGKLKTGIVFAVLLVMLGIFIFLFYYFFNITRRQKKILLLSEK